MIWVMLETVLAIHDRQLAEHGGLDGLRDEGALLSALARPRNLLAYGVREPTIADLAAAYIAGVARAHGFMDGNKRTAWFTGNVFLGVNGHTLTCDRRDAVAWMLATATGDMSEAQLSGAIGLGIVAKWRGGN